MPFTMFILTLLSLMGLTLLASSRDEVDQAGQRRLAGETFDAAESSAMVATLLSRVLLRPELGTPGEALRKSEGRFPLDVAINDKRFNLSAIVSESSKPAHSFKDRYLETGWGSAFPAQPHLEFLVNGQKVAAAVVEIDSRDVAPAGASLGTSDSYDASAATSKRVTIIVSVRGVNDGALKGAKTGPMTFITSMFREAL